MADNAKTRVRVVPDASGRLSVLALVSTPFLQDLRAQRSTWDAPIVLCGQRREDELAALDNIKFNKKGIYYATYWRSFLSLLNNRGHYRVLDDLFDRNLPHTGQSERLGEFSISGHIDRDQVIKIANDLRYSRHVMYNVEDALDSVIEQIDGFLATTAVRITLPNGRSLFPAFVLWRWLESERLHPFIIDTNKSEIPRSYQWQYFDVASIPFPHLCEEASRAFSISKVAVEDAYKVWQLSHSDTITKDSATIPSSVSVKNASEFIRVLSGTRPSGGKRTRAEQISAPLIFDESLDRIGIRKTADNFDSPDIIKSGATALGFQVTRLLNDHPITNSVPSARDMLRNIAGDLAKISSLDYDDGVVVGAALHFNALQWHIDAVKNNLSETTLGELAGLFATSYLFFRRFPVWKNYSAIEEANNTGQVDLAEFNMARSLLVNASKSADLLDEHAKMRVGVILSQAPSISSPPSLIEGVVKTGDNLTAAAINKVSEVAAGEAKEFGKTLRSETYKAGARSAINFANENAEEIVRFAETRHWPWASWIVSVVRTLTLIS